MFYSRVHISRPVFYVRDKAHPTLRVNIHYAPPAATTLFCSPGALNWQIFAPVFSFTLDFYGVRLEVDCAPLFVPDQNKFQHLLFFRIKVFWPNWQRINLFILLDRVEKCFQKHYLLKIFAEFRVDVTRMWVNRTLTILFHPN